MKKTVHERWANQRFGRVYVVEAMVRDRVTYANCVCDCTTAFTARVGDLKSGNTTSCGCFRKENTAKMKTTHGRTETDIYSIWCDIKKRCYNPKNSHFHHYGGRGISVSAEWLKDFSKFASDIGPRPTKKHQIDRINNDGNYEPGNCRWATRSENMRNTQKSMTALLGGEVIPLKELAVRTGIKYATLYYRVKRGLPVLKGAGFHLPPPILL